MNTLAFIEFNLNKKRGTAFWRQMGADKKFGGFRKLANDALLLWQSL